MSEKYYSEEEYLKSKGFGLSGFGELALHKGRQKTNKQQEKIIHTQRAKDFEYMQKRESLRKEYAQRMLSGEISPKSKIEHLIEVANGHPDLESTIAARNLLKKRGIIY